MNDGHVQESKSNHISDKSLRCKNYEGKGRYSNLCKYIKLPTKDKNTELEIEIEVDGDIYNLTSKSNNLLDVKIVEQSNTLLKTSLGIDEISDFIDMLNFHNANEKKDLNFQGNSTNNNLKKIRAPIKHSLKESNKTNNLIDDFDYFEKPCYDSDYDSIFKPPDDTQVFATQRTFANLKDKLKCQDPTHNEEKPGTPCLCQHCGMVGVLVESQKRPVIPHAANPRFNPKQQSRRPVNNARHTQNEHIRRVADLSHKSKSETNIILLKELANKIRTLEERISQQEEKSVPKDYFKYAIQKLLSQYSSIKEDHFKTQLQAVNIGTQYSKGTVRSKLSSRPERITKLYYGSHPKATSSTISSTIYGTTKPKSKTRTHKAAKESDLHYEGEDKQGIELKIKIGALIDELRSNKKKKDLKDLKDLKDIKGINNTSDEIKTVQFEKTVYLSNIINDNPNLKKKKMTPPVSARCSKVSSEQELINILEKAQYSNLGTESVKKLYDALLNKTMLAKEDIYTCPAFKSPPRKSPAPDDTLFRRNIIARKAKLISPGKSYFQSNPPICNDIPEHLLYGNRANASNNNKKQVRQNIEHELSFKEDFVNTKKVNVSYINPAVKAWNDERFSSDYDGLSPTRHRPAKVNKHTIQEKIEYLRKLAKMKNVDEKELWDNILSQAKKHIKSHDDTVSIQLPGFKKNDRDISELELTLATLKNIVKKSKRVKKAHSIELNYHTSSDTDIPHGEDFYQDYRTRHRNKFRNRRR